MKRSMRQFRRSLVQLTNIIPTLKLVWAATPRWTTTWGILLILQGLFPGATVYLSKQLVDGLTLAIGKGINSESLELVLVPAALMAAILLASELTKAGLSIIRTIQAELVRDHISRLVHQQSIAVDLAFYELPEFHDRLHQARDNASNRPLTLLENAGSLLQNGITLLAMATVLLPYGFWLPLVLLLSAVPAFYILMRFNKRYHQWWELTTPDRRQAEYHDFLITQSYTAAELRLFNLGNYLQSIYYQLRKRLRSDNIQLVREQSLVQLGGAIAGLGVATGAMAWIAWKALQGFYTLGDLALFYQAFNRGQTLVRSVLANIGQIYSNSLFLGNLFEFLNLKPQIQDPPAPQPIPSPIQQSIRFRNVTFSYPGSQRNVLQNFNLTIPAGKIVAIVGENGAGKSTLIKLLCRFYDPQSGQIEVDRIDIRNFAVQAWRNLLTVMFQFPVTYQKTVAENIAIGDVYSQINSSRIQAAIEDAGAEEIIARLPQAQNTQLGKYFAEGTDLSGGEWQRIALARAFFRQAPILILDEPTSFMDSWAEYDWLERFRTMAKGRTAIVITHRFTLAMRADIIHVMRSGEIIESGNHDTLLAQNGLYAQSWRAQTQASSSTCENSVML